MSAPTNYRSFVGKLDLTSNLSVSTDVFHVDTQSRKVSIGHTLPQQPLDVLGDIQATNFRGALIGNATTSTNTTGSSTSCNGNAATSTNCANAANTNGSSSTNFSCYALTASNNVTAYSDRRLKENIKPIENALDKVCQIGGYTFTRNDLKDSKKRHAGIIAQELMEVLPEVVEGTYETKYSVAYGNIIALLIEAIKELKHDVDQLK